MAHEITEADSMMYAKKVPWHGLGTYVGDEPVLAEEAITAAGLDWEVKKLPAFAEVEGESGTQERVYAPGHYLTVRGNDNRVLGAVGERYEIVQNKDAFEFLDAVVGAANMVRYHTAGSLRGGRHVWMLAEVLNLTVSPVKDDVVKPYLLLVNGHDGRMPLKVLFTTVRVVCANTLNLALRSSRNGIVIRHITGLQAKKQEAQRILGFAQDEVRVFAERAERLAKKQLGDAVLQKFLAELLPINPDEKNPRRQNTRDKIAELYETGLGTDIPGVKGTAWGALQAVTEYNSHYRSTRSADTTEAQRTQRLEAVWFGVGNDMNQKALELLSA